MGDLGSMPGWEDPLEKGKTTHFSILCRGPALVDPGNLKRGQRWQGKKFIYLHKIRLGRNSVVGKLSGEKRLINLVYVENQ